MLVVQFANTLLMYGAEGMTTVFIDDVHEGMELAEDVHGVNGRFLLGAGTVIEDKHLRIFKIWGVTEISVTSADDDEECEELVNPEMQAKALEYVDNLFRHVPQGSAVMEEIHHLAVIRAAKDFSCGLETRVDPRPDPVGLAPQGELPPLDRPGSARELVEENVSMASFPDVYFQIVEVLQDPRSTAASVADVVSRDPGLAVKLLKVVNSPMYGFPSRIDTISRAVALVGGRELSMLAMGVSVIHFFQDVPTELIDMRSFWLHSIACGVFARLLAAHNPELNEERFFLGGLIHDVGKLLILKTAPAAARAVYEHALVHDTLLTDAEQAILGFTHTEVGGLLLANWSFPASLVDAIRHHHSPNKANNPVGSSLLHVAGILARALMPSNADLFYVRPLDAEAWNILELKVSVLPPLASQAERLTSDIFRVLLPGSGGA